MINFAFQNSLGFEKAAKETWSHCRFVYFDFDRPNILFSKNFL